MNTRRTRGEHLFETHDKDRDQSDDAPSNINDRHPLHPERNDEDPSATIPTNKELALYQVKMYRVYIDAVRKLVNQAKREQAVYTTWRRR